MPANLLMHTVCHSTLKYQHQLICTISELTCIARRKWKVVSWLPEAKPHIREKVNHFPTYFLICNFPHLNSLYFWHENVLKLSRWHFLLLHCIFNQLKSVLILVIDTFNLTERQIDRELINMKTAIEKRPQTHNWSNVFSAV